MEKLTQEQIRNEVIDYIEKAFENKNEATYWLEKLPMCGDYDYEVHDYMTYLRYAIRNQNKADLEYYTNELIEFYYINQENYLF